MKKISIILFLAILLAGFTPIQAVQAVDDPWIITEDTTLTEDYYGTIIIAADDVTLDGNGYRIIGNGVNEYQQEIGIRVDGKSGVTVKNCNIMDFWAGIQVLQGSSNIQITGNTVSNVLAGVSVQYTSGLTITDNDVSTVNTGVPYYYYGVCYSISNSNPCTITGNTATNAESLGGGFNIYEPSDSTISDNYAYNVSGGFTFSYAEDSIISDNRAESNRYYGFKITGENNKVVNNVAIDNQEEGFSLYGYGYTSTQNKLISNQAINNQYGFRLQGATENTLKQNMAINNSQSGFELSWNCKENVFVDNTASGNWYGFKSTDYDWRYPTKENSFICNTVYENHDGFRFDYTSENILKNNEVYQSSSFGFYLARSSKNTITGNEANDNFVGFYVHLNSNENTIAGNTATGNSYWDAYQHYTCKENEWNHNKFDVTEGLP